MLKRVVSIILCCIMVFTMVMPAWAAADKTTSSEENTYIIKFKEAEKGKRELNKRNKKVEKEFRHLPSHISAKLTDVEAEELNSDPNVAYIEKDRVVKMAGEIVPQNLSQIHVPEVQDQSIYGTGINVAVFDTGIRTESTELKVAGGASFVPSESSLEDLNGHGTYVAGIIAALKDNQGLVGVAPKINLYNVKVLDKAGNGTYSQIIQGIDWAISNRMDVISMSLAGTEYSAALEEAAQLAYNKGILLLAAAGNDGANNVSYPAKLSSVIAVGSVDKNNHVSSFSNTGAEVELVAPGENIQGLSLKNNQYVTMNGTSAAVSHVAGVAALVKEKKPSLTNQDIRNVLTTSATPLGNVNQYGFGLVDANRAVTVANATQPSTGGQSNQSGGTSGSVTQSVYGSVYGTAYELSLKFHVDESVIDLKLMQGYLLQDIEKALQYQQITHEDLDKILEIIRPRNLTQLVNRQQVTAASESYATEYDINGLKEINLKPDQAPFAVNSGNEQISTLNGGLSIKETDLTLPGRNGLSFALTRTYSSGESKFFKEDVESFYWGSNSFTYDGYEYTQTINNGNIINSTNPTDGSYVQSSDSVQDYNRWKDWISSNAGRDISFSDSAPDANGNITRTIRGVAANPNLRNFIVTSSNELRYRNKASEKTDDEKMFHLGPGWKWNIPYISVGYPNIVHLGDGSTYEWFTSDWYLKGYPFNDLQMASIYDDNTQINNEIAKYRLTNTVSKLKYYFNSEGKPLQIEDAYGNTIQFYYQTDSLYGKVLWKIIDAIGNYISINYTPSQVTLVQGDKTVIYYRTQFQESFPNQPWYNTSIDMLQKVKDAKGNETEYTYSVPSTYFRAC